MIEYSSPTKHHSLAMQYTTVYLLLFLMLTQLVMRIAASVQHDKRHCSTYH